MGSASSPQEMMELLFVDVESRDANHRHDQSRGSRRRRRPPYLAPPAEEAQRPPRPSKNLF